MSRQRVVNKLKTKQKRELSNEERVVLLRPF